MPCMRASLRKVAMGRASTALSPSGVRSIGGEAGLALGAAATAAGCCMGIAMSICETGCAAPAGGTASAIMLPTADRFFDAWPFIAGFAAKSVAAVSVAAGVPVTSADSVVSLTAIDAAPCGGRPRICQASPATSTSEAADDKATKVRCLGARVKAGCGGLADARSMTAAERASSAISAELGRCSTCGSRSVAARPAMACDAARNTAASSAGPGSFCGNLRYNAASSASSGRSSSGPCGPCGGSGVFIRAALRAIGSWHSAGVISRFRGPPR